MKPTSDCMSFPALQKFIKAMSGCRTRSEYEQTLKEFSHALQDLSDFSSSKNQNGLRNLYKKGGKLSLQNIPKDLESIDKEIREVLESDSFETEDKEDTAVWLERCIGLFLKKKYHQVELLEEARKFQMSLEILVDPGLGFALVDMGLEVNYCNQVMHEEFSIEAGDPLPEALSRLVKKKPISKMSPLAKEDSLRITADYNFFNWNSKNYRVTVRLMGGDTNDKFQPFWAITIQPALDAFSRTNRLAQRVGLSWREVEICSLLHDGLDPNEVSNRLFISKHTVKTYLKRIYRKCGVHSRAQLIALLNQYSGNRYVV